MPAGQAPSAEELIADAIEAVAHQDVGRVIACLRAAAAVEPAWSMTALRMAEIELQTQDAARARRWLSRAARLDAGEPALPVVLGQILGAEARAALGEGANARAATALRQVLALTPGDAAALSDLASASSPDRAPALLVRSLAVRIWTQPLLSLGNLEKAGFRVTAAIGRFRMALALVPDDARIWNNLATTLRDRAEVPAALMGYRRALAADPGAAATESNYLQCLQFDEHVDDMALAALHRQWAQRHAAGLADDRPFVNERDPDRRLAIGYVSADLGRHPVGFLLLPVLEGHDRRQVRTVCYATRNLGDETTAAIRAAAEMWVDASRLDDDALADRIRADRIDILVDLSGHTAHHRLLTFARRPAPVQATWIGYYDSVGLRQIDYLMTDAWEVPPERRNRIVEEVVALPAGRFAYRPPAYAPTPAARDAGSTLTFGSFNNLGKVTDATVGLWARLLEARPEARLLLKWSSLADGGVADSIRRRFRRHGIAGDRLILRGGSPHHVMLAEYGDIDIALDPVPFSGCLTTLEALWMGVPVITLAGGRPVARQSAAILWRLGLGTLVAADEAAYVDAALALAADAARRRQLRFDLRRRMAASTLLDGRAVAASAETAFRQMWRKWCDTSVPGPKFTSKAGELGNGRHTATSIS